MFYVTFKIHKEFYLAKSHIIYGIFLKQKLVSDDIVILSVLVMIGISISN